MSDPFLASSAESRRLFVESHRSLLTQLSEKGQSPRALFITCSDSRIMPESLFGFDPGEFFVFRNIGNTIPPYIQSEPGVTAVLEFAILELAVPHLIVCGHTDCGAIHALGKSIDITARPALTRWLQHLRPAEQEVNYLMSDLPAKECHRAIVEQHVRNQMTNLRSFPFVRAAESAGRLTLHGWVYDLDTQQVSFYDAGEARFVIG